MYSAEKMEKIFQKIKGKYKSLKNQLIILGNEYQFKLKKIQAEIDALLEENPDLIKSCDVAKNGIIIDCITTMVSTVGVLYAAANLSIPFMTAFLLGALFSAKSAKEKQVFLNEQVEKVIKFKSLCEKYDKILDEYQSKLNIIKQNRKLLEEKSELFLSLYDSYDENKMQELEKL